MRESEIREIERKRKKIKLGRKGTSKKKKRRNMKENRNVRELDVMRKRGLGGGGE